VKTAILQVADTGPLESLVVMLKTAGYCCYLPDERLRDELRRIGCDTVLSVKSLVDSWGYDPPMELPTAGPAAMPFADLFVDIKAHRNGSRVVAKWPELKGKVLWYRINGCEPEHCVNTKGDHGDEVNLTCPILTPNLWYRCDPRDSKDWKAGTPTGPNWGGMAYSIWPPYHRFHEHLPRHDPPHTAPLCLIHNLAGWGHGAIIDGFRAMGVRCHGVGSPDGLIPHRECVARLTRAVAMVHLKSSDAPGYALYESLAAGCPVVCTRRLVWRNRMEELFVDGETCLLFDQPTHGPLDVAECEREVRCHLERLRDPAENKRIGEAGRSRLLDLMWRADRDGDSLREFMRRWFP
jgi:hypothetical protein